VLYGCGAAAGGGYRCAAAVRSWRLGERSEPRLRRARLSWRMKGEVRERGRKAE